MVEALSVGLSAGFSGDVVEDEDDAEEELSDDSGLRVSVMYHPLPLNITPTGWIIRRTFSSPQLGQILIGSAVIGCSFSKRLLQFLHSYS